MGIVSPSLIYRLEQAYRKGLAMFFNREEGFLCRQILLMKKNSDVVRRL